MAKEIKPARGGARPGAGKKRAAVKAQFRTVSVRKEVYEVIPAYINKGRLATELLAAWLAKNGLVGEVKTE